MADQTQELLTRTEFLTHEAKVFQKISELAEKKELQVVKEDVKVLKEDSKILKEDVKVLKEDSKILKEDVKVLKEDSKVLKADVQGLKRQGERHSEQIGKLMVDMSIVKEKLTVLDDMNNKIDRIITCMDGMARMIENMRLEMHVQNVRHHRLEEEVQIEQKIHVQQADTLKNHEVRIQKLESTIQP